jgi:Fur family ferric uptake transcriptional regulator
MGDMRPLVAALDRAGYRLTEPRRAVAELISARDGHFAAADLVRDARRRRLGIGRATIFRALDVFTDLNVVERLDLPTGDHAYVACQPRHHHHVVCSVCGRSTEFDDGGVRAVLGEIGQLTGYELEGHRLELFGRCPECQARSNGAASTGADR